MHIFKVLLLLVNAWSVNTKISSKVVLFVYCTKYKISLRWSVRLARGWWRKRTRASPVRRVVPCPMKNSLFFLSANQSLTLLTIVFIHVIGVFRVIRFKSRICIVSWIDRKLPSAITGVVAYKSTHFVWDSILQYSCYPAYTSKKYWLMKAVKEATLMWSTFDYASPPILK